MMKSHLILRLHRIILIAALFLAASCKEDDTSVQLKAPQTLTAIPSETSLLIEWGGDEAAAYELEARSDDYAFSTRVEDTRYELTGLEAYTEYEVRIRALVVSGNYLDSEWSAWERFKTLDKTIADEFDGGSGTEEDPYLIARPSQLALLAQCVNEQTAGYFEPDVHYLLTADLDLSGYENWTPIGIGPQDGRYPYENPEKAFQGVFDGGGHTVNNLNVAYTGATTFTSVGLFGVNDGTIRNLHVAGTVSATTSCTDKSYVIAGGIVGFNIIAYEDAMNTRPGSGAIEHCSFTGSVSASCGNDPTGTADAGGICGMAESGNIDFCETTLDAAHTIRTEGGEISMTGGIAGSMNGASPPAPSPVREFSKPPSTPSPKAITSMPKRAASSVRPPRPRSKAARRISAARCSFRKAGKQLATRASSAAIPEVPSPTVPRNLRATPQSRATAPSASAALSDRSPASVNAPSRSFRPKWVER